MTVQTLAAELGIDIADVDIVARWLTADEIRDEVALELKLRGILDPAGQRAARERAACPECGRLPGPHLVLRGWQPCRCGGHSTTYCTTDTGGCGHTRYEPELDPERCVDPDFGFSR
ncbi:MAG TPA: hypothetical protein VGE11_11020 [Pseudonocardia sp.]